MKICLLMCGFCLFCLDESQLSDTSRFNGHSNGSSSTNDCAVGTSQAASTSGSSTGTKVNLLVSSSSSSAGSIPTSPGHSAASNSTAGTFYL